MNVKIPQLWSLGYLNSQNALVIYRFTLNLVDCYLFELNEEVVKGIHANLQFELSFVTNDDDERFFINFILLSKIFYLNSLIIHKKYDY